MTPKEKALKLCQDFAWTTVGEDANEGFSLPIDVAKKCALIAVDEIMKELDIQMETMPHEVTNYNDFWIDVKKEIDLL